MTNYLLRKNLISALESLARVPTLSAFSALNSNFFSTQLNWSNRIPFGLLSILADFTIHTDDNKF